jgi:hypothetical protein
MAVYATQCNVSGEEDECRCYRWKGGCLYASRIVHQCKRANDEKGKCVWQAILDGSELDVSSASMKNVVEHEHGMRALRVGI